MATLYIIEIIILGFFWLFYLLISEDQKNKCNNFLTLHFITIISFVFIFNFLFLVIGIKWFHMKVPLFSDQQPIYITNFITTQTGLFIFISTFLFVKYLGDRRDEKSLYMFVFLFAISITYNVALTMSVILFNFITVIEVWEKKPLSSSTLGITTNIFNFIIMICIWFYLLSTVKVRINNFEDKKRLENFFKYSIKFTTFVTTIVGLISYFSSDMNIFKVLIVIGGGVTISLVGIELFVFKQQSIQNFMRIMLSEDKSGSNNI